MIVHRSYIHTYGILVPLRSPEIIRFRHTVHKFPRLEKFYPIHSQKAFKPVSCISGDESYLTSIRELLIGNPLSVFAFLYFFG